MKTRYWKVLRDITTAYARNSMLVLAIALGVFGIGIILGAYAVIKREMATNYMGTIPASATIEVEGNLTKDITDSVRMLPDIKLAERHATVKARMKVKNKWYPLLLFVVDDFSAIQTNKFRFLSGERNPAVGSMLVERTAFVVMQAKEGDEITIKTTRGAPKSIKLSGTVHDASLAPAWQEQAGFGYITLSTLHWLGEEREFDELRIVVSSQQNSAEHISQTAGTVAAWIEKRGYKVHEIQVPPPNKHPHQGQMNAVMSIFIVFSFMILALGSILVATSMATLMVKQVRQIGVMKTIGANSLQVSGLYLLMMLLICVMALLIAIPLGQLSASVLYHQLATLLNLEITNSHIPMWVMLLQISAGIIIPVGMAAIPVIRGSRISVHAAINNYGVSANSNIRFARWLAGIHYINETFTLAIRNVFRQRSRLTMTLGLLAAGGAMFMTALNVSEAWNTNLKRIYKQRLYDLAIKLTGTMQGDSLINKIKSINGVNAVEGAISVSASFAKDERYEITRTYPDKGHGSFGMQALPVATALYKPDIKEGQWLRNDMPNGVVLNQSARALSNNIKVGDPISFASEGKVTTWTVIGFTEDVGSPSMAYVSLQGFAQSNSIANSFNTLRISFTNRDQNFVTIKTKEIEALLDRENISIDTTMPVWLLQNAVAAHMKVLINALLAMAVLMAIVGTLGLMSTMSMNVMERTREIGVMRAIGATPRKIKALIVYEGLAIGTISIICAFAVSLLLSTYLGRFIGELSFRTPLTLTISGIALAIWLAIVLVGSYVASVLPASRANKITTREALAYE